MAERRFEGKAVLVTGGSRGIGAAIAKRFGREGARVAVNYVGHPAQAEQVVEAIHAAGGQAFAVKADISQPEEIAQMFQVIRERFGGLDILVNNAAVMKRGFLAEVTPEDFDFHFRINVRGPLLVTKHAAEMLPPGGAIINVSSAITRLAYPGSVVYSMTKACLDMMTQVLAVELGPKGIRVNTISPGSTLTDMNSAASGKTDEEFAREVAQTPLGRIGTPEDIADAAVFLASSDARWVTGAKLDCAGGLRG